MNNVNKVTRLDRPLQESLFAVNQQLSLKETTGDWFPSVLTVTGIYVGWPMRADEPRWIYTFAETPVGCQEVLLKYRI